MVTQCSEFYWFINAVSVNSAMATMGHHLVGQWLTGPKQVSKIYVYCMFPVIQWLIFWILTAFTSWIIAISHKCPQTVLQRYSFELFVAQVGRWCSFIWFVWFIGLAVILCAATETSIAPWNCKARKKSSFDKRNMNCRDRSKKSKAKRTQTKTQHMTHNMFFHYDILSIRFVFDKRYSICVLYISPHRSTI